eukprot:6247147-Pyramimonas_sp.AAC.1
MEGGWFSNCGFRVSAAHIRLKHLQEFHGLRATFSLVEGGWFSTCGSRLSWRTFVLTISRSFTD